MEMVCKHFNGAKAACPQTSRECSFDFGCGEGKCPQFEEAVGSALVQESPLRYEKTVLMRVENTMRFVPTGEEIPVYYWTDVITGERVAFTIEKKRVAIKQMRVMAVGDKVPPNKIAMKDVLKVDNERQMSRELTDEEILHLKAMCPIREAR